MIKGDKSILLVTGLYPPDIGGPATYCHLLNEELPLRGWSVEVLSFGAVRRWPKIIRHIFFFFQVLNRARFSCVIYVQDPVSVGLPACLAMFFLRRNFVLKVVGDYAWEQGRQRFKVLDNLDDFSIRCKEYSLIVRLLKFVQLKVAQRASKIIVPSAYLKKIVTNWGIHPEKIKVIYNSLENFPSLDDKNDLRSQLEFSFPVLVSVGRLVPWKGFDLLINLIPSILEVYPKVKLYIIGSGPDRDKLENLIKKRGLSENIYLTGQLARIDVLRYVKASDIFVLNTGYEGFSHQLLEVMQCGTPIITTNIGGNPELIKNNINGYLVDYNDAKSFSERILELLSNYDLVFNNYQQEAKRSLEIFSKTAMLKSLEQELL